MTHRLAHAAVLLFCGSLFAGAVHAQNASTTAPCSKDSVVLTHCTDQLPNNGLPAPVSERKADQQKEELRQDLDNQRAKSSAAAATNGEDDTILSPVQVTGRREKSPNPSEIFDSDLGPSSKDKPLTTQSSDSMGNRTECISKCAGPACCKTTPANPASPGVVP